jgi:hypothetical protein
MFLEPHHLNQRRSNGITVSQFLRITDVLGDVMSLLQINVYLPGRARPNVILSRVAMCDMFPRIQPSPHLLWTNFPSTYGPQ